MIFRHIILFFNLFLWIVAAFGKGYQGNHLVVLSHGLMGFPSDLTYLASQLREEGCIVLQSKSNQCEKTLDGIRLSSSRLVEEIREISSENPQLTRISFVGNSLGGLFARHALALLHNKNDNTLGGLIPYKFMTIATPHLGVREHTFIEEYGLQIPFAVKSIAFKALSKTGADISMSDDTLDGERSLSHSLLFKMATDEKYLDPLRQFTARRLYANLNHDFVVPLGTGAFLTNKQVNTLRRQNSHRLGIVASLKTEPSGINSCDGSCSSVESAIETMIKSLDSLGWEKLIVHFDMSFGVLPLAHNKICALASGLRYSSFVTETLFKFNEGQYVMRNATKWLVD